MYSDRKKKIKGSSLYLLKAHVWRGHCVVVGKILEITEVGKPSFALD